ncbi:MAG: ABC transporter ATP-binding protein [Gammaproteobacteria bacterium]|nr:ABC transporter ATP-binding protein [Gammaproteobacteria bacterium]MDE2345008.1 ABC transporter ATP-binding protein [Gammaproteobacteria bacterium]
MDSTSKTGAAVAVLTGVSKRYGKVLAVDGVNLEVRHGEVLALLGPNGAGKTTSVNMLLGLSRPSSGNALLFGRSPRDVGARRRIGAVLQGAQLGGHARVGEVIRLYSGYYPEPMPLAEILRSAGLEDLEKRPVLKLSGGQKQRLLFALAVCGNPELLFLDEPTAGLDVESRRGFWNRLREFKRAGRSIVLTTHYLEEADALADRIVVINRGRVVAEGTPAEIKRSVAQRHIRCVTALNETQIRRLPGVNSVRQDGKRLDIVAAHPEGMLLEMLKLDPALHDLEITGARLEEAFLALTENRPEEQAA